jgi:DNA-binding IclR family transcriptional regulator
MNICTALCDVGLAMGSEKGYRLGPALVELGEAYLSALDPVQRFNECCQEMSPQPDETIQLATLNDLDVVYLARHDGRQAIQIASQVGRRLPATCTALGKAMLAQLDRSALERRLKDVALPALTSRSQTSARELLRELAAVRDNGYSVDDEETTEGVMCIATTVPGLPAQVGPYAISVSLLKAQANDARVAKLVSSLRQLAHAVAYPRPMEQDEATGGS